MCPIFKHFEPAIPVLGHEIRRCVKSHFVFQVQVEATNFFGTSELSEIFEFLTEERSKKEGDIHTNIQELVFRIRGSGSYILVRCGSVFRTQNSDPAASLFKS